MKTALSPERITNIVRMALVERDVIEVMRRELKPSSFRLWRKRVSGRITKHRRLLDRTLKGPGSSECDD